MTAAGRFPTELFDADPVEAPTMFRGACRTTHDEE